MAQYRIVGDNFLGYEVQKRSILLPFWHQPETNTRRTFEEAEALLKRFACDVRYDEKGNRKP